MSQFDKKLEHFVSEIRRSWTFSFLILAFILTLWTFQLALIVTFQLFWPVPPRILKNNDIILQGSIKYGNIINSESHGVKGHKHKHVEAVYPNKVVCYLVVDDKSNSILSNSDLSWCTHINVGFAVVCSNSTLCISSSDLPVYDSVVGLKQSNPSLKVLVSVQDIDGNFGIAVSSDSNRQRFSSSVLDFMIQHRIDGIDIDWEWPSWPTPNAVQRQNFTHLLASLKNESLSRNTSMILSVAVGSPAAIMIQCYDISDMARYVDYVNLMSYDYHMYTKATPVTGANSPLYPRPDETSFAASLNTNWSATNWEFYGMPREKIVIGVPTYGHSFRLLNMNNNRWGAPASGYGSVGSEGYTTQAEACKFISRPSTVTVFDNYYRVPYSYDLYDWISHETVISIKYKAEFIKKYGYSGGMIFSLNTDDFDNSCGNGRFSLSKTLSSSLL